MSKSPSTFISLFEKRKINHPAKCKEIWIIFFTSDIWPVCAVFFHGFLIADSRERNDLDFFLRKFLSDQFNHQLLVQSHHVFLLNKAHFEVHLSKLRLSVTARVFVPKAPRELEITLNPRNH